ncbi:MAG TPA: GNAT family N-acetyltransferase [Gammaproteobacteria bacterium]|nr:GNAT family N-acetyltransferase [Gammaproteobacteria bacterium]
MTTATGPASSAVRVREPADAIELERYYELRWRLLRAPWDQPRGSERDGREDGAFHLMACTPADEAVAVGRLHFNDASQAQVRYMAVEPHFRGQGIGALLLRELEAQARRKGAGQVVLDARETAVGFYERCGYRATRPAHTLFGSIRHWHMEKPLSGAPADDPVRS